MTEQTPPIEPTWAAVRAVYAHIVRDSVGAVLITCGFRAMTPKGAAELITRLGEVARKAQVKAMSDRVGDGLTPEGRAAAAKFLADIDRLREAKRILSPTPRSRPVEVNEGGDPFRSQLGDDEVGVIRIEPT